MSITTATVTAVSVAEYSARIVRCLRMVGAESVEGEVQRPKMTPGQMLVFDLTDGRAKLACKVFPRQVSGLEHHPRHGDLVQVRIDRPDLWVEGGKLDVIVSEVRLAGEGELLRRREELLARLKHEGLCDPSRRAPLPRFPRVVGVIAGRGSDGLRDVVAALQNRFPPVHIVVCPAIVQGAKAPLDIIDALARLDSHPLVDVIVIARGGGSVSDLVAFDDERLCRAVSVSRTPVVAAIGHTDNVPVCNHVAWASETPSRSPELAVPSADVLRRELELSGARLAPLPSGVRSLLTSVAGIRIDASSVLDARCLDVAQTAALVRDSEHRFFSERDAGLARARELLASVPGRLPERAAVDALAGRLDTRSAAFFAQRAERVRQAGAELREVPAALQRRKHALASAGLTMAVARTGLDARARKLNDEGARLRAGIRKELADHLRDYPRALARRCGEIENVVAQRIAAERARVSDAEARLSQGTQARLSDATRRLAHAAALLAASDPRVRGWVLPTRPDGGVVRSVGELHPADRLTLSFHDGAAGAVIDTVPTKEVS